MSTGPDIRRYVIVTCVIFMIDMTSCSPDAPKSGGGKHKVTGILLLAKEHGTLLKEKNPTGAKVGDLIPFRVVASWAIPYVGDVTDKAKLSVEPADRARIDGSGVVTAVLPGKVTISGEVKIAHGVGGDKVLGLNEAPEASQAVTAFKDSVEITISEK